jgi:hypothetical protein
MFDFREIFLVGSDRVFVKLHGQRNGEPGARRSEAQAANSRKEIDDRGIMHSHEISNRKPDIQPGFFRASVSNFPNQRHFSMNRRAVSSGVGSFMMATTAQTSCWSIRFSA